MLQHVAAEMPRLDVSFISKQSLVWDVGACLAIGGN